MGIRANDAAQAIRAATTLRLLVRNDPTAVVVRRYFAASKRLCLILLSVSGS
jgi:hypothetical protein